jgi:hypothetical protein
MPIDWTPQNTVDPKEEAQFQTWIKALPWYSQFIRKYGSEPNLNTPDYNYRAAWKAGIVPRETPYDNIHHWPSSLPDGTMLKSENHPTAWMEYFMRKTGVDPSSLGLKTKEQGEEFIKRSGLND